MWIRKKLQYSFFNNLQNSMKKRHLGYWNNLYKKKQQMQLNIANFASSRIKREKEKIFNVNSVF